MFSMLIVMNRFSPKGGPWLGDAARYCLEVVAIHKTSQNELWIVRRCVSNVAAALPEFLLLVCIWICTNGARVSTAVKFVE